MDKKFNILFRSIGAKQVARDAEMLTTRLTSIGTIQDRWAKKLGVTKGRGGLTQDMTRDLLGFDESQISKSSGKLKEGIQTNVRGLKEFRMEYLSTMFFGMQVWRVFGGFFSGMLENYKKLDSKGNRPMTKALTKLGASFTYLKFQMLDAMSGTFTPLIMKLADGLLWLADLDEKTLANIGWGLGLIATAGLAMFAGSQVLLFADAVANILALSKINPSSIGNIGDKLKGLGKATGLVVGFTYGYDSLSDFSEGDFLGGIESGLKSAAGFSLAAGKMKATGALIAISAGIELTEFLWNINDFGVGKIVSVAAQAGIAAGLLTANPLVGAAVGISAALILGEIKWGIGRGAISEMISKNLGWIGEKTKDLFKIDLPMEELETANLVFGSKDIDDFASKIGDVTDKYKTTSDYVIGINDGLGQSNELIGGKDGFYERFVKANEQIDLADTNVKEKLNQSLGGTEDSTIAMIRKLIEKADTLNASLSKTINKTVNISYNHSGGGNYSQNSTSYG